MITCMYYDYYTMFMSLQYARVPKMSNLFLGISRFRFQVKLPDGTCGLRILFIFTFVMGVGCSLKWYGILS